MSKPNLNARFALVASKTGAHMTIDELLLLIRKSEPPAPLDQLEQLEASLGVRLPADYRDILIRCNGGHLGGRLWQFPPAEPGIQVGVNHIYEFRTEPHFSLAEKRECYQSPGYIRIPLDLLAITDDVFGNAVCIGLRGPHEGKIYFWDHELEPPQAEELEPNDVEEPWDGAVETAGNLSVVADSFLQFVSELRPLEESDDK